MQRTHAEPRRKVLVTGATGFIGGRLVRALVAEGFAVRALVRDRSRAALEDVELFEADLLRPESLSGAGAGIDVVVHCASLLGKWGTDTRQIHDVNVGGTVHLLEAARRESVPRFLYLSAGGVTGPVVEREVDENYVCRPATPYEKTKLEAERKVLATARQPGFSATVLRPTFTYGPGDPHKVGLFRAIKKGRYAFIGGGQSVNHPVYVDDLVRGILLAIDKGRDGEVYIIGGERPVSKREMAYAIADALGVDRPGMSIPRWAASAAALLLETAGRVLRFEPLLTRSRVMMMADNFGYSIGKAGEELGYAPRVDLREGIAATVRAYLEAGIL